MEERRPKPVLLVASLKLSGTFNTCSLNISPPQMLPDKIKRQCTLDFVFSTPEVLYTCWLCPAAQGVCFMAHLQAQSFHYTAMEAQYQLQHKGTDLGRRSPYFRILASPYSSLSFTSLPLQQNTRDLSLVTDSFLLKFRYVQDLIQDFRTLLAKSKKHLDTALIYSRLPVYYERIKHVLGALFPGWN